MCIRLVDISTYESGSAQSTQSLVDLVDSRDQPGVDIPMYPLISNDAEAEAVDNEYAAIYVDREDDAGHQIISNNSSRWRNQQMAPPRLSMRPGLLGSRESVTQWQAWKPTRGLDFEEVTIVVSIEDSGIGIPKHIQSQLFEPFVQADTSTSREYGGTGIGLSICQVHSGKDCNLGPLLICSATLDSQSLKQLYCIQPNRFF